MEKIYLDTSVISAYFDDRITYQKDLTCDWWESVKHSYELWISMVTRMELEAAGEPKRSRFLQLIEDVYLFRYPSFNHG